MDTTMCKSQWRRCSCAALALLLLVSTVPAHAQSCGWSEGPEQGPEARIDHAAAYDSDRDVVVLFGGSSRNSNGSRGDTWEWDGTAWSRVATSGPSARYEHAMVYDSVRQVCVLFGGWDDARGAAVGDTWEWDGIEWRQVATSGPGARIDHAMAFDAQRGVCVLFGGYQIGPRELQDTWEWNGSEWTQVASDGPSRRRDHAMTYDGNAESVLLFGGRRGYDFYADTWVWNGVEWTLMSVQGPAPRADHAMTFSGRRGRVLLAGGLESHMDVWEWDGDGWAPLGIDGIPSKVKAVFTHHAGSQKAILFGGNSGSGFSSESWEWGEPCAWLSLQSSCPRSGPLAIGWRNGAPSGAVAILASQNRGIFMIPNGLPCAGRRLGIASTGLQVVATTRSDIEGNRSLQLHAPSWACGMYIQLLDVARCATSNVERIEP